VKWFHNLSPQPAAEKEMRCFAFFVTSRANASKLSAFLLSLPTTCAPPTPELCHRLHALLPGLLPHRRRPLI
jgi:hypothetical protein